MVVGKVSEFIGSLYYLCVTLLRFKNIMKLKNYLLLLALLLVVGVRAQVPSGNKYPKREFRGAWIQAVNGQFRGIPTERLKQILISQLNSLQEAGINAIIFQVRPEADALYASQYEPWSRFLTGTQGQTPSPMWDPMQFMIEECQKRNMEFHAWINPYRVKTSLKNKLAPEHIYHQHPEWFVTYGNKYPKREFRGAWIQAVNGQFRGIPTERLKQILISQLNSLQEAGINAIIFQVRPEADALYASQYEPWSRFLTGTQGQTPSPMWDPMQFMIEECQKRNMEFHAWINPYRVKTSLKNKLAPEHIYHQHPEWFVTYGDQLYFDPALPESREHICKIVTDIVSRYDVDAIHMDDYFYPYPVNGLDFPDDASFARYGGGFTNKADWRRSNVNVLIKKLHETIRGIKPWVKFGISPFGIYRNQKSDPLGSNTNGLQNYDDLYADVLLWAREGWIDYNIPQVYWEIGHKAADYETLVKWWATHSENRPLFIGQSVPKTVQFADPQNPSINQLPRKMALQRAYQTIGGSCQWYAAAVVENQGRYRDALISEYHKYPALVPVFDFMDDKAPDKVRKMKKVWTEDGYILFWTAPKADTEMDKAVRYVVYRFGNKEKVNLDDPSHIVAITRNPFYKLPYETGKTKYRYVVTALDRLHNESKSVSKKLKL